MGQLINLTDMRFGRLLVLCRVKPKSWLCQCDCGNLKTFKRDTLKHSSSCGCYRREVVAARNATHGAAPRNHPTAEYRTWMDAKARCYNPKNRSYRRYGARGITMCGQWRYSFETFLADMGPRPPGTSIDRINNDGNYEPDNCRWATKAEQVRNRPCNVLVNYEGRVFSLAELARHVGVSYYSLRYGRLKLGLSPLEALRRAKRIV